MDTERQEQQQIVVSILAAATIIGTVTYLLDSKDFARGLIFGVLLTLINYWVVGLILKFAFRRASNNVAKVISFVGYQIRFLIIVFILFLVIPRSPYWFSVGTFVGVLLPKTVMGVRLLKNMDDDWWNNKSAIPEKNAPAVLESTGEETDKIAEAQLPQKSGYDDSQENPNFIA